MGPSHSAAAATPRHVTIYCCHGPGCTGMTGILAVIPLMVVGIYLQRYLGVDEHHDRGDTAQQQTDEVHVLKVTAVAQQHTYRGGASDG